MTVSQVHSSFLSGRVEEWLCDEMMVERMEAVRPQGEGAEVGEGGRKECRQWESYKKLLWK